MELSVDSKEHDLSDEGNQMEKCEAKNESLVEVLFQWRLARMPGRKVAFCTTSTAAHESIVAKEPVVQNCWKTMIPILQVLLPLWVLWKPCFKRNLWTCSNLLGTFCLINLFAHGHWMKDLVSIFGRLKFKRDWNHTPPKSKTHLSTEVWTLDPCHVPSSNQTYRLWTTSDKRVSSKLKA